MARFETLKRVGGTLLAGGAIVVLFHNELSEVSTARALIAGRVARTVIADHVDPANEGKLVHVTGPLGVPGTLTDDDFGVSAAAAIQLHRDVEMYQWSESKTGAEPRWSRTAINSAHFRDPYLHRNPPMRWQPRTLLAPHATVGAFRLDESVLRRLGPAVPMRVETARLPDGASLADGQIYVGLEPQSPRVGDMRISYDVVRLEAASVIGQQIADGIEPARTAEGGTVLLISPGEHSAASMLERAEVDNVQSATFLRVIGLGMLFGGLRLLIHPLRTAIAQRPSLVRVMGWRDWAIAGLVSLVVAPAIIAVGWLCARLPSF